MRPESRDDSAKTYGFRDEVLLSCGQFELLKKFSDCSQESNDCPGRAESRCASTAGRSPARGWKRSRELWQLLEGRYGRLKTLYTIQDISWAHLDGWSTH